MKTTDELFSDKCGFASFHDTVNEALELEGPESEIKPDKLRRIFNALPEQTRSVAHAWGMSDSGFCTEAWLFIQDSFLDFKDIIKDEKP